MEVLLLAHILENHDALGIPVLLLLALFALFLLLLFLFCGLAVFALDNFLLNAFSQFAPLIVKHDFSIKVKQGTVHQNVASVGAVVIRKSLLKLPKELFGHLVQGLVIAVKPLKLLCCEHRLRGDDWDKVRIRQIL